MLSRSMFRDAIRKLSLRQKLTILVSVGVLLPLLMLTYMQYRSLAELQNKTKGAFKDNLRQGITFVEHQMKRRLEEIAAQTLNPIGNINLSSRNAAGDLEKYFAEIKHVHPEIEEIFVHGYPGERQNTNAHAPVFDKARFTESFVDANRKYLFANNYLFYPLSDLQHEPRVFAGILLTERFVKDDLIAGSISKTIAAFHGSSSSSDIAFTISDENQRVLFANVATQHDHFLSVNLDPPFSNWKAQIGL